MCGIKGKVIVITGGSSGIGEAVGCHLASLGAMVVLAARRKDKLDNIATKLLKEDVKIETIITDVTKKSDVNNLIETTIQRHGRIDVMINNAGLMAIAPMVKCLTNEWDRMIDINIKGLLYGIAAVLPVFEKQGHGHIINISSIAGLKVFSPGGTVYSGTKFAVRAISEGLRHELAGKVKVTCIEPGAVESELKFGSGDNESKKKIIDFYAQQAISPDAIARAIAYSIEQPSDVSVSEISIRPTVQEF